MLGDNKYVCMHMELTKEDLLKAIRENNITTFEELQDETDVSTICGACKSQVFQILDEEINRE